MHFLAGFPSGAFFALGAVGVAAAALIAWAREGARRWLAGLP